MRRLQGTLAIEMAHPEGKRIGIGDMDDARLRGTYATLLSEEGVPVQDVQRALGHKDVRTTLRYLEVDMQRVARAQIRLAQRLGMGRRESGAAQAADAVGA